jgi:hypothetical protein
MEVFQMRLEQFAPARSKEKEKLSQALSTGVQTLFPGGDKANHAMAKN